MVVCSSRACGFEERNLCPTRQGGALATWTNNKVGNTDFQPLMVTHSGGGTYTLPIASASQMVLGENGTGFVTDSRTLVSFDVNSGAVAWTYDSPVSIIAATSGNGLAAQGRDQFGLMRLFQFDSNGVATAEGFAPDQLLRADWFGNLYDANGVLIDATINWASSFWATPLGSPSPNNASADMPWYPPLPNCSSPKTPCAGEGVWDAFKALQKLVAKACSLCDTFVFNKLNYSIDTLRKLTNKPALLSDGTRSGARATTALCGHALAAFGCPAGPLQTVADFMQAKGNVLAVSQTPSPNGLVIFFDPGGICTAGTAAGGFLNEATIFHEALHGLTGLGDTDLEKKLGIADNDVSKFGSVSISYYLEANIFGTNLHYFDPGGNGGLVCKEQ